MFRFWRYRVSGFMLRVLGSGFRNLGFLGSAFWVRVFEVWVSRSGFEVSRFSVSGSGFAVFGFGLRVSGSGFWFRRFGFRFPRSMSSGYGVSG